MFILGLTGSVAMGKSETGRMLRRLGVPVFDSDAAVHDLFREGGGAVARIGREFDGVISGGAVDRQALGARVYGDNEALRRLEAIVHPLVQDRQFEFLKRQSRLKQAIVVLDIPLLFESGAQRMCDAVAVVSAPHFLQKQRMLRRPGVDEKRFRAILAQQMPDREKRKRADYVIPTGLSKGFTMQKIKDLLRCIRTEKAGAWPERVLALKAQRRRKMHCGKAQ